MQSWTHTDFIDTEQSPAQTPASRDWQKLYAAERKRSRILGAATVAASLIAVGSAAWGFTANDNAGAAGPGRPGGPGVTNQFAPPADGGTGTTAVPGGPGAVIPGQDLAARLFNSDGTVNDEALQSFLIAMPGAGANLEQFLATAVEAGTLTTEQADQLVAAAGKASGSSTYGQRGPGSDTATTSGGI